MDCMEGMKQYPDKYFDLAVVDPPYGDASSQSLNVERERERETRKAWNRFGQRFDRYKNLENGSLAQQLPPERERERERRGTDRERTADSQTVRGVTRTGGTWAGKYAKKLLRGM
jgi:DNA modification methylase